MTYPNPVPAGPRQVRSLFEGTRLESDPKARGPSVACAVGFLVAVLLTGCSSAASGTAESPSPSSGGDTEIRAALRASADAWNDGDLEGHLAIYVGSVTFMTPDGPSPGVDGIEEAFRVTYFEEGEPRQRLGFDSVVVRSLGSDSALVTGRFVLSGGGLPEQSGWYTLVWVRTPGGWRVIHDHSS